MASWLDLWTGIWQDLWGVEAPDIFLPDSSYYNVLVEVYDDAAPTTLIDILHARVEPTVLSEIKGHGAGSFAISKRDPKIFADPSLIAYRKIIKIRLNGQIIGGFIIQTKKTIIVGEGEEADEMWEISGEGVRSAVRDAAVFPAKGLKATSAETRYFNFATERGSWYNPGDWTDLAGSWGYLVGGSWWGTAPANWPDAPNAVWNWSVNPWPGYNAPRGYNFFRYEFTVVSAASYSLFIAVDNLGEVYVDGEKLLDISTNGWTETSRIDFDLQPGEHVIGVKAFNGLGPELEPGPGGMIAALFTVGNPGAPTPAQLVSQTGISSPGWKVMGYPEHEPGWTVGDLLLTLLQEARDRNLRFAQNWEPMFSVAKDSNGEPWGAPVPWNFAVGTTYEEVFNAVEELGCDIYVDPDSLKVYVWNKRGKDRSIEAPGTDAAIILRPGHNLVAADETGQAQIANTLMLRTTEGWSEETVAVEDSDSVAKYGRVETQMTTQLSKEGATPLVKELFRQKALPEKSATFDIVPVPEMIPFIDFNVGDFISAPGEVPGVMESRRVMSISFTEDEATGLPRYAVEFDTIFKDRQTELEKWISRVANSPAMGGGFSNSGTLPSTTVTMPPGPAYGTVPDAPTGLIVNSTGFYTNSGESSSDFSLSWNAVTTGIGFGTVDITQYEIWARRNSSTESQLMGVVFDTFAYLQGFRPGDSWYFQVRAISRTGGPGPFSPEVGATANAPIAAISVPSTPTLSSTFGSVTVAWDGLLGGVTAPPYIRFIRVERATSSGGPWTAVGVITSVSFRDSPGPAGNTYWYRLIAVDGYGNTSSPSGAESVVVQGIASGDITGALPSTNLVFNGSFEDDLSGWEIVSQYATGASASIVTSSISGSKSLRLVRGSEVSGSEVDLVLAQTPVRYIPISPAGSSGYFVSARSNAASAIPEGFSLLIDWFLADKTTAASTPRSYVVATRDIAVTPAVFVGKVIPPADARFGRVGVVAASPSTTINVDDVVMREAVTTNEIGEGALVPSHFSAGSVTANALAVNSVSADAIQAGSILSDKIGAGQIITSHLSAGVGQNLDISSNTSINLLINRANELEGDLSDTNSSVTDLQAYYSFGVHGAIIGKTDSAFKLYLKNDRIEILENGIVVSYWDSGRMVVPTFVGEEVILANHKIEKYGTGTIVKAV